jgi:hypothetical protein
MMNSRAIREICVITELRVMRDSWDIRGSSKIMREIRDISGTRDIRCIRDIRFTRVTAI